MNNGLHAENTDKFLYKELSYKIIGCCMKIHGEYGPHHNERIYHKLIEEVFIKQKIEFISKPKISVYSRESGKEIGCYYPDFLIDNLVILELKANPMLLKRDEIQLSEYLKIGSYEVAYLVNFGTPKLYFKRIIFTNDRKNFLSFPKSKSV
jgi:GxxExxY protein